MKATAMSIRILFLAVILIFSTDGFGQNRSTAPAVDQKTALSQAELKKLIATAKTKQDHLRIAAYYHAEALRLRKEAAEHEDLATAYADRTRFEPKGVTGGELQHCKRFAAIFAQGAQRADELAEDHRRIAERLDKQ